MTSINIIGDYCSSYGLTCDAQVECPECEGLGYIYSDKNDCAYSGNGSLVCNYRKGWSEEIEPGLPETPGGAVTP